MAMKERNQDIATIKKDIKIDADKASNLSRFGYFSIIYPAYLGDEFYSVSKKKRTNAQNKVITSPRNISSNPTKIDKYPTSFFTNVYQEDNKRIERLKEAEEKSQQEKINKVKFKKSEEFKKQNFKAVFRPGDPKEYRDYFEDHKVEYSNPIYKVKNRFLKIDKEKHKVITDPRNIQTNPMKRGTSAYPGVLFSFKTLGSIEYKKRPNSARKLVGKRGEKKEFKRSFKPAALKKNEAFSNNIEQFGEDPKVIDKLVEANAQSNKPLRKKWVKKLPDGSLKHIRGFKPPRLEKMGMDLFSKYEEPILPKIEEKKVKKKKEAKGEYKSSFKPNKLVDNSNFSSAISSFTCNLKREFPIAFHKY